MPFTEAEKIKDPILRVLESLVNDASIPREKLARAAMVVNEAESKALVGPGEAIDREIWGGDRYTTKMGKTEMNRLFNNLSEEVLETTSDELEKALKKLKINPDTIGKVLNAFQKSFGKGKALAA